MTSVCVCVGGNGSCQGISYIQNQVSYILRRTTHFTLSRIGSVGVVFD